jgi:hypothetical protein
VVKLLLSYAENQGVDFSLPDYPREKKVSMRSSWLLEYRLLRHLVYQRQQTFENFKRRGRASPDVQIHRDDILDGSGAGIAAGENAAIGSAIA